MPFCLQVVTIKFWLNKSEFHPLPGGIALGFHNFCTATGFLRIWLCEGSVFIASTLAAGHVPKWCEAGF